MISKLIRRIVFERDRGLCAKCGADCEKVKRVYWSILDSPAQWLYADLVGIIEGRSVWEVDHIQEQATNGDDSLVNLQTLCRKCHSTKSIAFTSARLAKGDKKRVPLNCLISPATVRAILGIQEETGESQGVIIDRAVALLCYGEEIKVGVQGPTPRLNEVFIGDGGGSEVESGEEVRQRARLEKMVAPLREDKTGSPRQPKVRGMLLKPSERGKK